MPGTVEAVKAQQAAMALVQALHHRQSLGPEVVHSVLREANHEDHPVNIMVALASLVPAVVAIAEWRVADVLADPLLLYALGDAAATGIPMGPAAVGLSVGDVLAAAGVASVLNEPS